MLSRGKPSINGPSIPWLQGGAPKIAKLVQISPITIVFVGDTSIVNGLTTNL